MLTLNVSPVLYNFSKSPMWAKITTDNYVVNAGVKAQLNVIPDDQALNVIGGTFNFKWATGSVTMTIVADDYPDESGTQVPDWPPGMPAATYCEILVYYFNMNYLLSDLFNISVVSTPDPLVYFEAKEIDLELDLTPTTVINTGFIADVFYFPVAYQVQPNYKMLLDVYIESIHNSAVYSKIGTQELDPVNNSCIFDISRIVNAYLQYQLPASYYILPFKNNVSIKKFFVRYTEKYGSPVATKKVYETSPTEVIKSGLPYIDAAYTTDAINNVYISNGAFLTRQPFTKKVIVGQQEFMSWICPPPDAYFAANSLPVVITIATKIYFVNNDAPYTKLSNNVVVAERELWMFPLSFAALGIAALGAAYTFDKVSKYEVTLVWSYPSTPAVSETFTFVCDHDSYLNQKMFLFTNSDGGIDTFRATGARKITSDIESDVLNIRKQYGYTPNDAEYNEFNKNKTSHVIQNTGFLNRAQLKWLDDFFLAEHKWEVDENNAFIPIVITSQTKPFDDSQTKPFSFDFEYFYAFNDVVIKSNEVF